MPTYTPRRTACDYEELYLTVIIIIIPWCDRSYIILACTSVYRKKKKKKLFVRPPSGWPGGVHLVRVRVACPAKKKRKRSERDAARHGRRGAIEATLVRRDARRAVLAAAAEGPEADWQTAVELHAPTFSPPRLKKKNK